MKRPVHKMHTSWRPQGWIFNQMHQVAAEVDAQMARKLVDKEAHEEAMRWVAEYRAKHAAIKARRAERRHGKAQLSAGNTQDNG